MSSQTREAGSRPALRGWLRPGLRLAGAGLLIATGAIHLDLYLTGYRTIPTIGWTFLLQVIVCFALGAATLLGSRLAAAAGALFALATLGGYLLSVWVGLFGFREVRTTAGIAAGIIEVAAFAALAAVALAAPAQHEPARHESVRHEPARPAPFAALMALMRERARVVWAGTAALSAVALVLLAVALAGAGSPAGSSASAAGPGPALEADNVGGVRLLTNSKGFTLYLFVPDTPTSSKCYGSCAAYWPPVLGTPKAGAGVNGTLLGTIKRTDGTTQATYDGHPLYTYIADGSPGQDHGNNINLNGGLWKDVPVSG
jgi:predicted lipoprotein with Yx(FWY)xxD motif